MQSLFLNTHDIAGSFFLSVWVVYHEIFIYDKLTKKEEAKKRSKKAINFKILFQDLKDEF